jgi:hypothetical protein
LPMVAVLLLVTISVTTPWSAVLALAAASAGGWEAAFATGAVLAVIAGVLWLLIDTDPVPESVMLPDGGP